MHPPPLDSPGPLANPFSFLRTGARLTGRGYSNRADDRAFGTLASRSERDECPKACTAAVEAVCEASPVISSMRSCRSTFWMRSLETCSTQRGTAAEFRVARRPRLGDRE